MAASVRATERQAVVEWDTIPTQIPARSGKKANVVQEKATDLPLDSPRIIKNLAEAIQSADYTELLEISSHALPVVSFWGARTIRAVNYEGHAPIDALAERVMQLVRLDHFEYSEENRAKGRLLAREITRVYLNGDEDAARANCFTRFFCRLRSVVCLYKARKNGLSYRVSSTRWQWEFQSGRISFRDIFNCYSRKQFVEKYGKEPKSYVSLPIRSQKSDEKSYSDCCF